MDTIILNTGLSHVRGVLQTMDGVSVELVAEDELEEKVSNKALLVMDVVRFQSLSEEQCRSLGSMLKLLLIPPATPVESVRSLRRASTQLFFLSSNNELDAAEHENLISVIRALFAQQQMAWRLNSYIRDSFQTIIDAQIVERQKKEIEKLNEELHSISRVDYLTNLLNRRAFLESLESERKRAQRNRWRLSNTKETEIPSLQPESLQNVDCDCRPSGDFMEHFARLSCLILDIDFFKTVNDTYGHLAGDMVLRKLGHVLRDEDLFRENDIIGRFGGEEFIIVLPETSAEHARIPAERLRKRIKEIEFTDDHQNEFTISLSIGIAESLVGEEDSESLIHRADIALYQAKETGRDKVCVYGVDITETI